MKILVIEDEPQLNEQLRTGLSESGYECRAALDGEDGLYQAQEFPFDLLIVDLGLPKVDGIEIIKTLRKEGDRTPILILTARGGWQAKVEGLEAGADDYMEKPFHIEELIARTRALMRRAEHHSTQLHAGPLTLDIESQIVNLHGKPMSLTSFEYKILEYMIRHPGQVISKQRLTDYLYDQDFDRDSNVIEVFVGRLRKKLAASDDFAPIQTLRGRGYQFVVPNPS